MFPPDGLPVDEARVLPVLRQAIDGEYGGLRVTVDRVSGHAGALYVETSIYDANGNKVGQANRTYSNGDGRITAVHTSFRLEEGFRGRGCASEFNKAMFEWYAQSGVSEVRLTASSTVGCYAWASAGFDFENQQGAIAAVRGNLRREIRRMYEELAEVQREQMYGSSTERELKVNRLTELIAKAEDISDRFYKGSPGFPKPQEIAELGKPVGLLPGQSRALSWPGKRVFTEPKGTVSWHGVKRIKEEER